MSQRRSNLHYALIADLTAMLQRCNNEEQSHNQSDNRCDNLFHITFPQRVVWVIGLTRIELIAPQ